MDSTADQPRDSNSGGASLPPDQQSQSAPAFVSLPAYKPPSSPIPDTCHDSRAEDENDSHPPLRAEVFDGANPIDMTQYPARCVGKVICGAGIPGDMVLQTNVGTGVLIGPNVVLTACHILPWGHSPPLLRFIPGYSAGAEPFGRFDTFNFTVLPASSQVQQAPSGIDVALLFLDQSPGNTLGWFGTQSSGNAESYKGNWLSTGYPAEKFGGERAISWGVNITDVNDDVEAGGLDFELVSPGYASAPWVGGPLWHLGTDLLPYVGGVVSGNRDGRTVHAGGPLMGSFITKNLR